MINEILKPECIRLNDEATTWRDAITAAGDLLVKAGYTTDDYTKEMIAAVESLGPYIVIAPSLALAHSRPAPSVKKTGLSLVRLADPVNFGSEHNDPVSIVIALCAVDHVDHLEMLAQLSKFLGVDGSIEFLKACQRPDEIYRQINHVE